jgi:CelD/BcsL family acetyltransferase involved in cellulose biosynthesis
VSFFALLCGDRVVATLGGVRQGTRFSGMLTSFTAEPDIARTSPGELLLGEVMALHGAAGFTTFDLGIGEARYKESYCPDVEELFDSLVPVSVRGHLVARLEGLRLQAKRAIKQSPWAWPLAQRVRRARAALATRPWTFSAAPSGGLPDEAARHED